jgi:hypothetical protein
LGFRPEGFGSSASAGSHLSNELPRYTPQREARGEIAPEEKLGKNICLGKFLRDRPDPMEEQPPQDDDPNPSGLNPMCSPLFLPAVLLVKGSFLKNRGWASLIPPLTRSPFRGYVKIIRNEIPPGKGKKREDGPPAGF